MLREGEELGGLAYALSIVLRVRVMATLVNFADYHADKLKLTERPNLAPTKVEIVGALEVLEDLIEARQRKLNALKDGRQTNLCSDISENVTSRLRAINEQRSAIAVLQKTWSLLVQLRNTSVHR
jgi:DNA phosphorothioation-dependent restriction protein DptG